MTNLIYYVAMRRSKRFLCEKYGAEFYRRFKKNADRIFREIIPQVPDIGYSIFSFNYQFGPAYIAWYKSFQLEGLKQEEIDGNIWRMNERMVSVIPRPFMRATGKAYFGGFQRKAAEHMKRQESGRLHPYDWVIEYRKIDSNRFEIDITECAMQKLARQLGADGLLPGICRMDYLFSHLMGNGFVRTKTLGDGDACCNCQYAIVGTCDWSPENGFIDRK